MTGFWVLICPVRVEKWLDRGTYMRWEGWAELVNDEEHGGCVIPMMAVYHEHDEDPEMRTDPISAEQRERLIAGMAAGLLGAYRYFRKRREPYSSATFTHEPRRTAPKVGRNEPCSCGSGKKYKRCCGGARVNLSNCPCRYCLESPETRSEINWVVRGCGHEEQVRIQRLRH